MAHVGMNADVTALATAHLQRMTVQTSPVTVQNGGGDRAEMPVCRIAALK